MVNNNNKLLKLIFILPLFIIACGTDTQKDDNNILPVTKTIEEPPVFSLELPEPSIKGKKTRFKLTELSVVKEKFLRIKDHIVFTGLRELKNKEEFKNVTFSIKSHCILGSAVLMNTVTKPLTQSIPLIELLPIEVLLHKENFFPSCGFSFKAVHKNGSAHHFELPQLPIKGYNEETDYNIKIFSATQTVTKSYPYIQIKDISQYWLNLDIKIPISTVDLVCADFSLSFNIQRKQQIIPMSMLLFNTLSPELQKKIQTQKPIQNCRFFGYQNKVLKGVSLNVYIVFKQNALSLRLKTHLPQKKVLNKSYIHKLHKTYKKLYEKALKTGLTPPPILTEFSVSTYSITNSNKHNVYLFIGDVDSGYKNLNIALYNLYYSDVGQSFYTDNKTQIHLGPIETISGKPIQKFVEFQHQNGEIYIGTMVTLTPNTKIRFSAFSSIDLSTCYTMSPLADNGGIALKEDRLFFNKYFRWLGIVGQYPDLLVHQILSDKLKVISSKDIQHTLKVGRSEKGFELVTEYLGASDKFNIFRKKHPDEPYITKQSLYFSQGTCATYNQNQLTQISNTAYPILQVTSLLKSHKLEHKWSGYAGDTNYLKTQQALKVYVERIDHNYKTRAVVKKELQQPEIKRQKDLKLKRELQELKRQKEITRQNEIRRKHKLRQREEIRQQKDLKLKRELQEFRRQAEVKRQQEELKKQRAKLKEREKWRRQSEQEMIRLNRRNSWGGRMLPP